MIAKVPAKKHGGRGGFNALVRYVTDGQSKGIDGADKTVTDNAGDLIRYMEKGPKVSAIGLHNINALHTAHKEMADVVEISGRKGDPVYHFVLSWQDGEHPTDDQAFAAARHALKSLGMEEHQAVFAVHRDTEHHHVHVAVNRVHPGELTIVHPRFDYVKLDKACREIELLQGWAHDNGPMKIVDINGDKIITRDSGKFRATQELSPEESRDWWTVQYENVMEYAQNQDDINQGLALIGPEPKNGEKIWLDSKGRRVEAPKRDPKEREENRILRREAREKLYERYKAETHSDRGNLKAERKSAFDRQRASEKARLQTWRKAQQQAKLDLFEKYPDADRRALSSIAAAERAQSKEKLLAIFTAERAELSIRYQTLSSVPSWHDWCRQEALKGDEAAKAVLRGARYQEGRIQRKKERAGLQPEVVQDTAAEPKGIAGITWHITKSGVVSYRLNDGAEVFRDLGHRIDINEATADREAILAALQLASEKWGGQITITGDLSFKEKAAEIAKESRIKINNPELEKAKDVEETKHKAKDHGQDNDFSIEM